MTPREEAINWIKQNIQPDYWSIGFQYGYEYEFRWIWALYIARSPSDMSSKDRARDLMEGVPPLTDESIDYDIEEAALTFNDDILPLLQDYYQCGI